MTLIPIHNGYSAYDSDLLKSSKRTGSAVDHPTPLSRLEFERDAESDQCPTPSFPQSDVVMSELAPQIQPKGSSRTLIETVATQPQM